MPIKSTSPCQNPDTKHAEKRAIPRFASFKPNTPPELQSQGTESSEKSQSPSKDHDHVPHESRSEHYDPTLGQHHLRGHHGTRLKGGPDSRIRSDSTVQDLKLRENTSDSFTVDRRGDINNLQFGALRAATLYFRSGAGNVVGLPKNLKIDRATSTNNALILSDNTHGLPNNRDRHARWKPHRHRARELKIKPREEQNLDIGSTSAVADYIPLKNAQRAKRKRGDDASLVRPVSSSDENDTHDRSVKGKAKPKEEAADQDVKYNSDTSSSEDVAGSHHLAIDKIAQRKHVQLSSRVDAEPTNFEAWTHLISHQDSMLELGQDAKRTSYTYAERRSIAEIKLAIFEKALEKVEDSQGRESLLLGMMQEVSRIWEKDRISLRWKSILKQNWQSLRLWIKYLDFMQTSFSFRFEEVRSAYLHSLDTIHRARTSGVISPDELNKVFEIQIYVVLRMALFMRESGFVEHATAAWQALLEFVFFRPVVVQNRDHTEDKLFDEATVSMFEQFWDSEVPRIGEEGAGGWASFSQRQGRPPQPRTEPADGPNRSKNHWKLWLALERRRNLLSRTPARTIDDIEVNDPYRIILFSDIRPFLINPPSPAGQQLILDAFIAFCCLPPFAAEGPMSCSRVWRRDCFVHNEALRLNHKLQVQWNLRSPEKCESSGEQDSTEKGDARFHLGTRDPFLSLVRDYQVSPDSLFAGKDWVSAFDTWQEQLLGEEGPVEAAWVLRALKPLIDICIEGEGVALYVLALEFRISPETVKRTAKNILRKRPFSIRLYNAYALIEYRLAGIESGEEIITTSIKMSRKLNEVFQRDIILLWRTRVWETLTASSARDALVRLLAIGDEEVQAPFSTLHLPEYLDSVEPALLLRTERALVDTRDYMISLSSFGHATLAIECMILFAYLRNGQSLSAATSAFKSNTALLSTLVSPTSSNHEYLHQSFVRLLYYHATHTHLFKPADIRSRLAESIAQFPQNTIFLSLYGWNEARFRINDRLRSVVEELVLDRGGKTGNKLQDSVVPHFFAIYSELHRAVTFGSNNSTVRSTFERAVQSDIGVHCAGLWKLYFLFENSRYGAERAKVVFWRGLRACPWAKDLYMLAFEYFSGEKGMDEAELRGIYELLVEKELRRHVSVEDILGVLND